LSVRIVCELAVRNLRSFDGNWHKCSTGQGHETVNFWSQEVKVQGHTRPTTDLEA